MLQNFTLCNKNDVVSHGCDSHFGTIESFQGTTKFEWILWYPSSWCSVLELQNRRGNDWQQDNNISGTGTSSSNFLALNHPSCSAASNSAPGTGSLGRFLLPWNSWWIILTAQYSSTNRTSVDVYLHSEQCNSLDYNIEILKSL